jgi:hypothetical protein
MRVEREESLGTVETLVMIASALKVAPGSLIDHDLTGL